MNALSAILRGKFLSRIRSLIFYMALLPCAGLADTGIIGQWSGIDSDGDTAIFVFNEDQSAELKLEGVPPLTSANVVNGRVEWSGQTEDDPMLLDFIIIKDSEEIGRIPIIAGFLDAQTLKIQMSRNMKTRPENFELSEDVFQIVTTRQ